MFYVIGRQIRENGMFNVQPGDYGAVLIPVREGRVLNVISANPETSTRKTAMHEGVSQITV